MNRSDFQELADVRIAEAQALLGLSPPRPDGAYYLAGYAVECALKAAVAKLTGLHDWPDKRFVNDSHTHDVQVLIRQAGLEDAYKADIATNTVRELNWTVVKRWSERSRYERHGQAKVQELVEAVTDPVNGVLPWIKAHW